MIVNMFQRLKSLSLDKDSLKQAINYLQDRQNIDNAKNKFLRLISTQRALVIISCSGSMLIAIWLLPDAIKRVNSNKALHATYLVNIEQISEKSIQSKVEKDIYDQLSISQEIIERMLATPQKILYLPELLRQASAKSNVRLLSFKPYESENEFMQEDIVLEVPGEFDNQELSLDELDQIPDELNDAAIDTALIDGNGPPMLIPEIEVAPRIDIDIREFAIEIEGDYLNIQRFFGELQNHKLLYSIKEIKYAMSSQGINSNAGMYSRQGGVQASVILRLPQQKK